MHAEHLRAFRAWLAVEASSLAAQDEWVVNVPSWAVSEGVTHRLTVNGYPVRYTVQSGDSAADVAAGLEAAAAPMMNSVVPIEVASLVDDVFLTSTDPFLTVVEPPLVLSSPSVAPIAVVWANQTAPQVSGDYILLTVGTDTPEGREEVEQGVHAVMDTSTVRTTRLQTVDLLLVGAWSGVSAFDVRRVLETPSSVEALSPYVVRNMVTLLDAPIQQDTMTSARIALSVELAYADSRRVEAEAIEQIEALGVVGPESLVITAS